MNIIGITGAMGSGKDAVANCFMSVGYKKMSMASPMKEFVGLVFGFTQYQLWGPSDSRNAVDPRFYKGSVAWLTAYDRLQRFELNWITGLLPDKVEKVYPAIKALRQWFNTLQEEHPNLSPRVCLQTIGTEWGRAVDVDIWVKYLARKAQEEEGRFGVVVPDVRFVNELQYFKDNDYPVIHVSRPGAKEKARNTGVAQHTSETEQQDFDPALFSVTINNSGTFEELLDVAKVLAERYKC